MFTKIKIKTELLNLIQKYVKVGGVIEYSLYKNIEETNLSSYELQKSLIIEHLRKYDHRGYEKQYKVFPQYMKGELISEKEFMNEIWRPFSNPPYGMKVKDMELKSLFDNLNNLLLKSENNLDIYSWTENTSWCPEYFKDGEEWWGCYFFTFKNSNDEYYIISASTTD
jgi:hypothetical protein